MKIQIILGSTRPGRVGERVANWVLQGFAEHPEVDVELVDLADYSLPHFDEALPPRANKNRRVAPSVARYLSKIASADGYIIVTPEYNFSFPGVLKDALDFVDYQMHRKPVAVVSYGVAGGARASQDVKGVLNGVKAVVIPEAVALSGPQGFIDESGTYTGDSSAPFGPHRSLETTIRELVWWLKTLSTGRRVLDEKIPANR